MEIEARAAEFGRRYESLRAEIGKVIVGHREIVEGVLTCMLAGGHGLLEGVPGLGKTLLVRTLSQALDLPFARIQFTPDLMPADVIGTNVIMENEHGHRAFTFMSGPIFAQIVGHCTTSSRAISRSAAVRSDIALSLSGAKRAASQR